MQSTHLCVGVAYWQIDEFAHSIATHLEALGCHVELFEHMRMPSKLDVVFAYGPFGSLVPLANQLRAYTEVTRPSFVFFMTEQLPNPELPELLRRTLSYGRSRAERFAYSQNDAGVWQPHLRWQWLTGKGLRYRYYGDLRWLQRERILSLLALQSVYTAGFLRRQGIDPFIFTLGADPKWGADLELERDIPVLWLGKHGSNRRKNLLYSIRDVLQSRGVNMMVVDGIANPYVFDEKRTILLNRTQIVLNLSRQKWDLNSIRFYLAASNRAMMLSEPILAHIPEIESGKHYVETPLNQMADTICYYLAHPEERSQIADQAFDLVSTKLTMDNGLRQLLQQVVAVAQTKRLQ